MSLKEIHQTGRIGELVVVKLDRRALRPGIQLGNTCPLAHRLDPHDQHQRVDLFRQGPEPVDQLCRKAFQLDLRGQTGKPAIQPQPDIQIKDIAFRNHHRHAQIQLRRPVVINIGQPLQLARFDLGNRVFQHLLVKFIADFGDMSRLLFAQKVARPAQVKVVAGKVEPCAKVVQTAQKPQPFRGLRRQWRAGFGRQVTIGPGL